MYYLIIKCLAINDNWELKNIPIAFEYLGGSHTGDRIKKHYDQVVAKYSLTKKVYKVVTDQGE